MPVQNAKPKPEDEDDEDEDNDEHAAIQIGGSIQAGREHDTGFENEEAERRNNPLRNQSSEAMQIPFIDYRTGEIVVNAFGEGPYSKGTYSRSDMGTGRTIIGSGTPGTERQYADYGGRGNEQAGAQGSDLGTPDTETDRVNAARLMGKRQPAGQDEDYLPLTSEITGEHADRNTGAKQTRTDRGKGTDESYCDDQDGDYDESDMYPKQGYVGQGHGKPPTQNVYYASAECLPVPGGGAWPSTTTPGIFGKSS
jgi:hypothetical protein